MTRPRKFLANAAVLAPLLAGAVLAAGPGSARAQGAGEPAGGYHQGAIFRMGLGGAGAIHLPEGAGAYGGYAGLGYWLHERIGAVLEFRGYAGPSRGKTSFSLVDYSLRTDWCARELLFSRDLCLVAGPSWAQVGGTSLQGGNGHNEFGVIYGLSAELHRFDFDGGKWWMQLDLEAAGTTVLTGPDEFTLVGAMLYFWFRPDAGVVGTKDTY